LPASTGVRELNRVENTEAIKAVAREHLARDGAASLSLGARARDVGMVSSALYRYFPSRDDLLTALIVDAFDAVGQAAEEADSAAPADDLEARWLAVAGAIRTWAIANPHEYALVYGSPVPGYAAPHDTVLPAARVSLVFLLLVAEGVKAGAIETDDSFETTRQLRQDFARLRHTVPGVPDGVIARGLLVWTQLFGHVSYELFGHLHRVIEDYDALFELEMRRSWRYLCAGTPP
jgi:AcrR family transcriptional regulator